MYNLIILTVLIEPHTTTDHLMTIV